jgi:N-acetylneuraminic acid mutarotase
MPLELYEQVTAVVPNAAGQSILYAIGGGKVDSPYNGAPIPMGEVRAYNVATNTWTSKQDMPVARWGMNGAGVIGQKIYVTGGYDKTGWYPGATAGLYVYDLASNTWTRKRDMPAAGGAGVTGVIGGKLYVVTHDYPSGKLVVYFFRYTPATNSWTKLPGPADAPVLYVSGGVINNKLYVTGAMSGFTQTKVLEYDPVTNHWTQKQPWTNPSCGEYAAACYISGPSTIMLSRLYVFGHYTADRTGGAGIFIYDPITDTWSTKPLLTTFNYWDETRLRAAKVFVNGSPRVEVIGGYRPGNNQQYIP